MHGFQSITYVVAYAVRVIDLDQYGQRLANRTPRYEKLLPTRELAEAYRREIAKESPYGGCRRWIPNDFHGNYLDVVVEHLQIPEQKFRNIYYNGR